MTRVRIPLETAHRSGRACFQVVVFTFGLNAENSSLSLSLAGKMAIPAASAAAKATSSSSMASTIRAYSLPLILFIVAMYFQLSVIPKSFPPSHYAVLGLKSQSSIEEVKEAYDNVSSTWNSEAQAPDSLEFIKIRYAYELLTNPSWKRNYDIFGFEEQIDVIEKLKKQYAGESFSRIDLPLLESTASDSEDHNLPVITSKDFQTMFQDNKPWLIQLCSFGSKSCDQFSHAWKRIAGFLDGVAKAAQVDLEDIQLATYLADKKPTGQPFFRNSLPSFVAFPQGCKSAKCLIRYEGDPSIDSVTDWFATTILGLPRILYYSKESLGEKFLAKVSLHKVKVIFFSKTGERAAPIVRQAAKSYWAHASFAFVLWREEESSFWFNSFEVESAPAIVFLKDPGVKPVVYHGSFSNSRLLDIIEQNKEQELPQLRSTTSMQLGCDAQGYSRAGYDTVTWYCAVVAGRHSPQLSQMRRTLRRVQETLSNEVESIPADEEQTAPAARALQSKRLTFAWLDGEAQKKYCLFFLQSETSYETCGSRTDMTDVPKLFIIRYKRNVSEESEKPEGKPKSIWDSLQDQELDPAAQLVAKYNGSDEIPEITKWISQIIKDGDARDLPHYRTRTPQLVPDDSEPIWSSSIQRIPSTKTIKQSIIGILRGVYDRMEDPRIGPILLLAALMSFGNIWLRRSQATPLSNQPNSKNRSSRRRRDRSGAASTQDLAPSITDMEPRDSYEMPLSGSDSDQ
ncbi:uncharacterized protein LOC133746019 [Rosa rugosa]|uniref:uncharacterized protein LOC133746019 n=1 Tax=Rosa rugosa TaxID=74645 RepID=UPI002B412A1E|nr:uncharacterized protein LOC133746019 [Rosa rugosa]